MPQRVLRSDNRKVSDHAYDKRLNMELTIFLSETKFANLSKLGKQLAKFLSLDIVVVEIVKNWGGNSLMKKLQPDLVELKHVFSSSFKRNR